MTVPRVHGIREFSRVATSVEAHAEAIRNIGYTIVADVLDPDELAVARSKIDSIYERQVHEAGGADRLRRIDDEFVARSLLAYDDFFLKLATDPAVIPILELLLGEYFILMSQNAIINSPIKDNYQVTWHRDLNYQHFVSSRPLAISTLFCIDDFSEVTGGTCMLPASHRAEEFPSDGYVNKHTVQLSAKAGSVLVFDAMIYHRAGFNKSELPRRAVNHIYTLPLIKQQISFPRMLGDRVGTDTWLRRLLGYETETAESVQHWRDTKLRQRNG